MCGFSLPLAIAAGAQAQTLPTDKTSAVYSLSWARDEGADGCPTRAELAREVSARLGRVPFDDTAQHSIEIHVDRIGDRYASRIHLRDEHGQVLGRRALESDESDCEAIFSATALAVALLIDPDAMARERQPAPHSEPSPSPPAPAPPGVPPSPAGPITAAPPTLDQAVEEPRSSASRSALGFVGVEGVVAVGLLPKPAPGFSLYAGAALDPHWGYSLSAQALLAREASAAGASFDVGLTAFGLAATYDFLPSESAQLALELGPLAGALHASVKSPDPRDAGDFWFLAMGAGLRAQVPVSTGFFLGLHAALVTPLVRRGLKVVGVAEPVWRQPWLAGTGGAGVGLSFF